MGKLLKYTGGIDVIQLLLICLLLQARGGVRSQLRTKKDRRKKMCVFFLSYSLATCDETC